MANKGGMPEGMKNIMGWVLGLGIIAFILLIMVIIFGNLSGNVGFGRDSNSFINETINLTTAGNIPAGAQDRTRALITSSSLVVRDSTGGQIVTSGNYTLTGITIAASATSNYTGLDVNVSYTVTDESQGLSDSNSIILNYTASATNTSAQFPTVGTIIGIAILLLILIALLVFAIRKMMGVANVTSMGQGSSGGGFNGSDRGFS